MTRFERWVKTGWDPESGRQVPYNEPVPLPPHQHDPIMSGWCGICQEAARIAGGPTPRAQRDASRDGGRER